MRWHLVATDNNYFQCKGFQKIPSNYIEIWGKPLSVVTIYGALVMIKKISKLTNNQKWPLQTPS